MYIVKLNKESTNKLHVYIKHALIITEKYDEYMDIIKTLDLCNSRIRRQRFKYSNEVTAFLPNNGKTWVIYVCYRFEDVGNDWETDIAAIMEEALPRKR